VVVGVLLQKYVIAKPATPTPTPPTAEEPT
jgi:hypothetical protein